MTPSARSFHLTRHHLLYGMEPKNAWAPVLELPLMARVRVAVVIRVAVASASPGVAWIHEKAWARLAQVRAGAIWICGPTCGACCYGGVRESGIESEIGQRMRREW